MIFIGCKERKVEFGTNFMNQWQQADGGSTVFSMVLVQTIGERFDSAL